MAKSKQPKHLEFADERAMILYIDDQRRLIQRISAMVGTFDLSSAGIALDKAEESGVDTDAGRRALAALTTIRAVLMNSGDWPDDNSPFEGLQIDPVFADNLLDAARIVDGQLLSYDDEHNAERAADVRLAARIIGGLTRQSTNAKTPPR